MVWLFVPPKVNAQCDGIRGKAFWRWVGHEDGTLVNEINALIKDSTELPCLFPHVKGQWEARSL